MDNFILRLQIYSVIQSLYVMILLLLSDSARCLIRCPAVFRWIGWTGLLPVWAPGGVPAPWWIWAEGVSASSSPPNTCRPLTPTAPQRSWSSPSPERRTSATWRTFWQVSSNPLLDRWVKMFSWVETLAVPPGAYIRGRFTQRDVDQRAVLFVLPADVEVTADSFQFRLIDPAGNTALPEM